jgi:hypothetical protein
LFSRRWLGRLMGLGAAMRPRDTMRPTRWWPTLPGLQREKEGKEKRGVMGDGSSGNIKKGTRRGGGLDVKKLGQKKECRSATPRARSCDTPGAGVHVTRRLRCVTYAAVRPRRLLSVRGSPSRVKISHLLMVAGEVEACFYLFFCLLLLLGAIDDAMQPTRVGAIQREAVGLEVDPICEVR